MSDNTILNASTVPGGDKISTDELTQINGAAAESGLKVQRVKVGFGPDGSLQDVTDAAPLPVAGSLSVSNFPAQTGLTDTELRAAPLPVQVYGELLEALEAMRMAIASLTRTVGQAMPDTAGRMRVNVETGAITASLAANQTLATLSNQTLVGGLAATEQIPSLMRLGADSARRNISVT